MNNVKCTLEEGRCKGGDCRVCGWNAVETARRVRRGLTLDKKTGLWHLTKKVRP